MTPLAMPQLAMWCGVALLIGTSGLPSVARADQSLLLRRFCVECHGEKKPEADLSLHNLTGQPSKSSDIEIWKLVLEKVESGEMPPEDAKQPSASERTQLANWIQGILTTAGATLDEGRWTASSKGNRIDHDALFSPTASSEVPRSKTRARLWRLTGQAYEAFLHQKNVQFALGIRNYGEHKMRAPWNFTPQRDFSDYATTHKIGEAEIEYHMRNATKVAKALVVRIAGRQPSPGFSDWIPEMNAVIKAGEATTADQAQAATVATFQHVLNRKPSDKEQKEFSEFLLENLKPHGAEKAVEHFLIALLFRPEVMYRVEVTSDGSERQMLAPRHLARALSFALTDSVPDETLNQALADGKLTTRDEVRAQVVRMLGDSELDKPRVLRFFQEYFGHHAAIGVFKDEVTLKAAGIHKNSWYPKYFVSDVDRLIEWVLAKDQNVLYELLTTNKTFMLTMDPNGRDKFGESTKNYKKSHPDKPHQGFEQLVLDIYEVPLKSRTEWFDDRPFEMPQEHRMGILTHPAWLVAQSGNFDNHAIHRGRWIREKLLGGMVPDVPITVNAMLPDEPHKSLRDRMRVTKEEYCWKCHRQMDPLGLAFEQFDHFGRFRTVEQVVDLEATMAKPNLDKQGHPKQTKYTSVAVDTSGSVERSGDQKLDGEIQDPFELLRKLAASKRVEQVFVRHAFRYFMGRNETLEDAPTLISAHQAYANHGGSMNALITELLTSDAFLYRHSTISETAPDAAGP